MTRIYLIRHGQTAGNLEHRYVGITDEPLCEAGVKAICARRDALWRDMMAAGDIVPEQVYVSPMLRCRQSAKLLFPEASQHVVSDFKEMDFGEFEYKNYAELAGDKRYQAFIDSGGSIDFPGAEPQQKFRWRVQAAFERCMEQVLISTKNKASMADEPKEPVVFLVHGGTIMAILDAYAVPHRDYFDWQVQAASGYCCEPEWNQSRFVLKNAEKLQK